MKLGILTNFVFIMQKMLLISKYCFMNTFCATNSVLFLLPPFPVEFQWALCQSIEVQEPPSTYSKQLSVELEAAKE
jgi:hypothetical protein